MIIPDNAKDMILFALGRRGITPVHVEENLIVFDVQFASGLALAAVITATRRRAFLFTKPVIALGVLNPANNHATELTEHVDLPNEHLDVTFGVNCASTLLSMVRVIADLRKGGHCVTAGWLGQFKSE